MSVSWRRPLTLADTAGEPAAAPVRPRRWWRPGAGLRYGSGGGGGPVQVSDTAAAVVAVRCKSQIQQRRWWRSGASLRYSSGGGGGPVQVSDTAAAVVAAPCRSQIWQRRRWRSGAGLRYSSGAGGLIVQTPAAARPGTAQFGRWPASGRVDPGCPRFSSAAPVRSTNAR